MSSIRPAQVVLAAAIVGSAAPARSSTAGSPPGPPPAQPAPTGPNARSATPEDDGTTGINLATNPIGWFLGFYGLSIGWSGRFPVTVRVDAELIRPRIRLSGYEIGISAPIYFRRNYDGAFVEPGLLVRDVTLSSGDDDFGGMSIGPEVMLGWHWRLVPRLNVALALGVAFDVSGKFDLPVEPAGYFRVGSTF